MVDLTKPYRRGMNSNWNCFQNYTPSVEEISLIFYTGSADFKCTSLLKFRLEDYEKSKNTHVMLSNKTVKLHRPILRYGQLKLA